MSTYLKDICKTANKVSEMVEGIAKRKFGDDCCLIVLLKLFYCMGYRSGGRQGWKR